MKEQNKERKESELGSACEKLEIEKKELAMEFVTLKTNFLASKVCADSIPRRSLFGAPVSPPVSSDSSATDQPTHMHRRILSRNNGN